MDWLIAVCKRTLALRAVPKCKCPAIGLIETVVSLRSRAAIFSFAGSLLRRDAKSAGFQPRRDGRRAGGRARLPEPARVVIERLTKKTEPEGAKAGAVRSAPFGSKLRPARHQPKMLYLISALMAG